MVEPTAAGAVLGEALVHGAPEAAGVVRDGEVGELMDDDGVHDGGEGHDEAPVEAEGAVGFVAGTAGPEGLLVADGDGGDRGFLGVTEVGDALGEDAAGEVAVPALELGADGFRVFGVW